jgi:membrane-associated phospholipid phosphatase
VHAWALPLAAWISLPKEFIAKFGLGYQYPLQRTTYLPIHIFEGKQIFLHSHFEKINIVSCIYMLDTISQTKWNNWFCHKRFS